MSISNIRINCDMGESFGLYKMGNDEETMPFITEANVACGFHGSDPNHMRKTVRLAKQHKVRVGAHFSFPDLAGFGRREMRIERQELANIIIYQIGALKGFLQAEKMELAHLKPHGALYGMAAKQEHIAHAVCDAAEIFRVPLFGLSGTLHEDIYTKRGLEFVPEFFADLDYDDNAQLLITREHAECNAEDVGEKTLRAVRDGIVVSAGGKEVPVQAKTICIHSDTPNVVNIARAVKKALETFNNAQGIV